MNVAADPLLSESLLYPCREGTTRIGAAATTTTTTAATLGETTTTTMAQDVVLSGLQIQDEHAVLMNHTTASGASVVDLMAMEGAPMKVNGVSRTPKDGPIRLLHGDWIV